ncbi:MAG: hypothetical protein JXR46_04130 [Calditrichaceae bacterium]|nr:hypothetical protein [Calditrichaceae bacterium]MBN2708214.1 hypothetical protein [Calditrichaceae bacterium]RQV92238.1 MAG: hypothetical protein EH224_16015 [Calditrichota bacterium]
MNRKFIQNIVKSGLLIAVFSLVIMQVTTPVFLHTHTMEDGRVIVHSHPYTEKQNDSQKKSSKHTHNNVEYYYYSSISDQNKFFLVDVFNGLNILESKECHYLSDKKFNSYLLIFPKHLRAPPTGC